ncbi:MAG: D-alanyl-D-alanine carboxypeptidase [Lachnospiraceae bacterium]|nr:D-alanyl-D-alanine carboxypeptidase [Lachnospiraceae bacterium]
MKHKLKRLLFGALTAVFIFSSVPLASFAEENSSSASDWPEPPEIESAAAVVMEASTGSVLYNKSAYDAFYPASTTKLMTSLLAIEQCPLSDIVTCSKDSVESIGWDSSRIGLVAGESIDMENALYAILLASANEVSYAVGEHIAGTMDAFVAMMNQRAKDLGCVNTHFMNPHGLHNEQHYSCPYDLALIARKAIEYTTFRRVSGSYNHRIPETNLNVERYIANTHGFIKKNVVYEGVFAGKTGYTSEAGNCLVTCVERDGMTLICALMKAPNSSTAYKDTTKLLDYAFENFTLTPLAASETTSKNAFPVLFEDEEALISEVSSPLSVSDTSLILPEGVGYENLTKKVTLNPSVAFTEGENVIGEVLYYYADNYVGSAEIIYHSEDAVIVQPSPTPEPTQTPVPSNVPETASTADVQNSTPLTPAAAASSEPDDTSADGKLQPLIIGIITAVILLVAGIYIFLIELPYQKKKKAYYRNHGRK